MHIIVHDGIDYQDVNMSDDHGLNIQDNIWFPIHIRLRGYWITISIMINGKKRQLWRKEIFSRNTHQTLDEAIHFCLHKSDHLDLGVMGMKKLNSEILKQKG